MAPVRDGNHRCSHVIVAGENGCRRRLAVEQLLGCDQSRGKAEIALRDIRFDILELANGGIEAGQTLGRGGLVRVADDEADPPVTQAEQMA